MRKPVVRLRRHTFRQANRPSLPDARGSERATQMAAIGNGILVFCGLITAAAASLLAAVDKVEAPSWMRGVLGCAAGFALLAGVLVLGMMTAAHNQDRHASKKESAKVDSMRRRTSRLGTAANVATAVAAALLLVGLILYIRAPTVPSPAAPIAPSPVDPVQVTVTQTCAPVIHQAPEPFCK